MTHALSALEIYRLCVLSRPRAFTTRAGQRIYAKLTGRAKAIAVRLKHNNFSGKSEIRNTAKLLREWMDSNNEIVRTRIVQ